MGEGSRFKRRGKDIRVFGGGGVSLGLYMLVCVGLGSFSFLPDLLTYRVMGFYPNSKLNLTQQALNLAKTGRAGSN